MIIQVSVLIQVLIYYKSNHMLQAKIAGLLYKALHSYQRQV